MFVDFVRCGTVAAAKGKKYELLVTNVTDTASAGHVLILEGYNLHQCIRLLLVPDDVKCVPENIDVLVEKSTAIMGGSPAFPKIVKTYKGSQAEFSNIRVNQAGTWKACLVQFAKPEGDMMILGAEPIGTVKAILKAPKTSAKQTKKSK